MKVGSAEDFEVLLNGIAGDVLRATHHRDLHRGLMEATQEHSMEFDEARTFWHLTFHSHESAILFSLARLYDQRSNAICLPTFLRIVRDHPHFFEERSYRLRAKKNPSRPEWSRESRVPCTKQLEEHLALVKSSRPEVKKLNDLRNKALAHLDAGEVLRKSLVEEAAISWIEIDSLIKDARIVVNHYSYCFRASTYASQMVGHWDYQSLLTIIREWRVFKENEYDEECDSAS